MHTTSIRDFKKEKVLGTGSFGSVYLVRRRQDNKIYALKTVNLEKLNKREQENSVNEVRILASVNHPNVIGYKEAFWDDDKSSLNIVMEYADDGDLHNKIEKMKKEGGCFKEPLIWSYAIQMIEGLKALHDMKIMHRDLKSANIFLVKDKHQCKIGDMNVSKVIKEKALTTQTGTPYYASPEVWKDNPYSYKSDLWSIGCVIYELCSLRPPFQGKDLDELYENVCKGKPERINKMYSDDLWNMILMLLQVDVNKRIDCNQFLNNDLIKRKIEEMKKEPNIFIESYIYDKNKDKTDDHLLKTIRFNDIKEIKAQLPTKKNYNSNIFSDNLKYNKSNQAIIDKQKMYSKNNEEILSKKIKEKQIELQKMKNYLKNDKSKKKIRKKILINFKDNSENINNQKTVIYKKNNISNSLASIGKHDSFLKGNHPEINLSYLDSGKKKNIVNTSERGKKTDIYDLYLKKYVKINNQSSPILDKDRCITPMMKYNMVLNNKSIPSLISQPEKNKNPNKKKPSNCLTYVDRKKEIKYIEEENEKEEEIKPSNTLEANHNSNYIYNKQNLIIKKQNSIKNNLTQERPQSATPIYKRTPKLNHLLYKSNIPISNSFRKEKMNKKENIQNELNSPYYVKKENKYKEIPRPYKLNRYYSYGVSITTPTNSNQKPIIIEKEILMRRNPSSVLSPKQISNNSKKYIKKLNVKSYQQKLNEIQNDNFFEKKAIYGKIFEREKNKENPNEKNKIKNKGKKGIKKYNLNLGNNNKNGTLLTNKSNAFLHHIKTINNHEENNSLLNCYLSPKHNNSQVFNNFYSINLPAPVKVINVFKK